MKYMNESAFSGLEAAIVLIAFVVVVSAFSFAVLNTGFFVTQEATGAIHTGLAEATSALRLGGEIIATPVLYITLSNGNIVSWPSQVHGSWEISIGDTVVNLIDIKGVPNGTIVLRSTVYRPAPALAMGDWIALLDNRLANDTDGTMPIIGNTIHGATIIGRGRAAVAEHVLPTVTNIRTGETINHITIPLTLAAGGHPVDLNRNRTTITYIDCTTHTPNVYIAPRGTLLEAASLKWIIRHDEDNILEFGETALFTIPISGVPTNSNLRANEEWTIIIQPPQGSALTIQRRMPPMIDPKIILRT